MKHIIYFLSFLTIVVAFTGCNTQPDYAPSLRGLGTCEDGEDSAIKDASNGKYKLLTYGLILYVDWEFTIFYEDYVLGEYGIELGDGGVFSLYGNKLLFRENEELIYAKFGEDIFKKALTAAEAEYKINMQEKIDTGYVFDKVDSLPEFIGGNANLHAYLSKELNNPDELSGKILAFFIVEKNGSVSNVQIKDGLSEYVDNQIVDVLLNMPKWKPGTHLGRDARVRVGLPIKFILEE